MPEPIPENRHVDKVREQAQVIVPPVPRVQPRQIQPQVVQVPLPDLLPQDYYTEVEGSYAGSLVLGCLGHILVLLIMAGLVFGVGSIWHFFIAPVFAPQVQLMTNGFAPDSITTTDGGGYVKFVNPSGIPQILCLGQNGICDAKADGPQELKSPGLHIDAGQSKDVFFDYLGSDYHITSTGQPWMNLKIHVPEPQSDGP